MLPTRKIKTSLVCLTESRKKSSYNLFFIICKTQTQMGQNVIFTTANKVFFMRTDMLVTIRKMLIRLVTRRYTCHKVKIYW